MFFSYPFMLNEIPVRLVKTLVEKNSPLPKSNVPTTQLG